MSKKRRRSKTPKPAFDLRPLSGKIRPGTILFLRNDEDAIKLRSETSLNRHALGHPCVVVSPSQDCDLVRILLLTTFHNTRIEKKVRESYWQEYLPIEPTGCHPGYPGVQLCVIGSPNKLGGYVNIVEWYWVPWKMLTKWDRHAPADQVRFDDASIELIFYFMEWATYDVEPGAGSDMNAAVPEKMAYRQRLLTFGQRPRISSQQPKATTSGQSQPTSAHPMILRSQGRVKERRIKTVRVSSTEVYELEVVQQLRQSEILNRSLLCIVIAIAAGLFWPAVRSIYSHEAEK